MRIIGNIEHPVLKITVFKMDNKLSVKFETGQYEQTYKFRESDELHDFESMQRLVDEQFTAFVLEELERMHRAKNAALGRFLPKAGAQEFEEII
jgi:geranylgeranyl pyrophosphate synthase